MQSAALSASAGNALDELAKMDIAAMKIDAIGGRGVKRDFIDLYLLCKEFTLENCLNFYVTKYPTRKDNLFHTIKSLSYFNDAEKFGEPEMLVPLNWNEVMKYFTEESNRVADKFLQ
ncbi:MAG: hypothetical protein Q7S14_03460 [bacterium]|nr:hypothetical protein [bacterium]